MRDLDRASVFAVVAVLGIGLLPAACADQANPVLPPSGGGGGKTAGTTDRDAAVTEVSLRADAEDAYVATDVEPTTCNMLLQDCPRDSVTNQAQGCYRWEGSPRCLAAGDLQVGSHACEADSACAPGLVCDLASGTGGDCATICDPTDTTFAVCLVGQICKQMGGAGQLAKVGYCHTPT
jgi:hypothetical protein